MTSENATSRRPAVARWASIAAVMLFAACHAVPAPNPKAQAAARVHYLEIVCRDVAAQCTALARVHALSFGAPVADLGQARVATAPDGLLIGVRAPMAAHEQPIVRTYLEVADIGKAIDDAKAAGGVVAYPPTRQGDTGTWAIYFVGDVQFGLWQR